MYSPWKSWKVLKLAKEYSRPWTRMSLNLARGSWKSWNGQKFSPLRPHQIKVSGHGSNRPYILRNQKKMDLFLVMCLFWSAVITFSIFCCWKCQKTSNSQQILVQFCMYPRAWVSEDVLHAVSNDHKYDLFQIQGHKIMRDWDYVIISPVLHFGHTCTPNKFQLNLLAHLEAFVYQKCHRLWLLSSMWLLNSLVTLLAISYLSIVSFSLLNYANNKLNKKKLHKEQELLVKHCFCVTFTFLLCKFPVELQFRGEFRFIPILHSWPIVLHGRLSRKSIIPILSLFWQLQVYKRLGKKNKFSLFAKEDILNDTTYQEIKIATVWHIDCKGHVTAIFRWCLRVSVVFLFF